MALYKLFIPKITPNINDGWRITAPHQVRERLYKMLRQYADDSFKIDGPSHTEVTITPYPGITRKQAYLFAVGYLYGTIYTLLPGWHLGTFWQHPTPNHMERVKSVIQLPSLDSLTLTDLDIALSYWIQAQALHELKTIAPTYDFQTGKIYQIWQEGVQAYTNLLLVKADRQMGQQRWEEMVSRAERLVKQLQHAYERSVVLQRLVDAEKLKVMEIIHQFRLTILHGSLDLGELYRKWIDHKYAFVSISNELTRIQALFQETPENTLQELYMITGHN